MELDVEPALLQLSRDPTGLIVNGSVFMIMSGEVDTMEDLPCTLQLASLSSGEGVKAVGCASLPAAFWL